ERHLNSHRVCHGGIIFALADAAIAYASCSTNRGGVTMAANVSFVRGAQLGDRLSADALLEADGRRTSMAIARVTDQNGKLVALVQGNSLRFETPVLPEA
ncbi:MAG TPA: hotdog fold thioesterase, partial [Steroidobacteraceae bacterium]|nr:hotdog fold thioesterase [Steroidobacteraceae bacterium]